MYDEELNDTPVATSAFWIARYPVTVAQFLAFVAATGQQIGDKDALRDPDSRPVRRLSWHEALAYCRWLMLQLQRAPALAGSPAARLIRDAGWQVSLPSELEWEIAARGGLQAQAFSWSDVPDAERANCDSSGIDNTCAVGCFAANGFGLHDMLGNVWEWTRSLWSPPGDDNKVLGYPYHPDDAQRENPDAGDSVRRVVRGGSWLGAADGASCAFRGRGWPDDRSDLLGFRVVLRSPPV